MKKFIFLFNWPTITFKLNWRWAWGKYWPYIDHNKIYQEKSNPVFKYWNIGPLEIRKMLTPGPLSKEIIESMNILADAGENSRRWHKKNRPGQFSRMIKFIKMVLGWDWIPWLAGIYGAFLFSCYFYYWISNPELTEMQIFIEFWPWILWLFVLILIIGIKSKKDN